MNKNFDNNDTDDVVLDEELLHIEDEINVAKQCLDNAENPKELNLDHQLDDKTIESMYDKIRKMPRDEMMKLLANLAKSNQMPDHKFSTVSDSSRDNTRARLKERLRELELRRTKKSVLNNYAKKAELEKKKDEEKQVKSDEKQKNETAHNDAPALSKSQKNRLRKKRAKDAKLNQSTQENDETVQ